MNIHLKSSIAALILFSFLPGVSAESGDLSGSSVGSGGIADTGSFSGSTGAVTPAEAQPANPVKKLQVTASLPSGTYNKAIKVELVPSDPAAKTFFSFNPNGTPNDAFLYTGAILITKTTPLIFFSFVTTSDESKIMQNDYTFVYSDAIKLGTGAKIEGGALSGSALSNGGSEETDLSYWSVSNPQKTVVIPEGTMLSAGGSYPLDGLVGPGKISLRSPDGSEKDSMKPQEALAMVPSEKSTAENGSVAITSPKPKKRLSAMKKPIRANNVALLTPGNPTRSSTDIPSGSESTADVSIPQTGGIDVSQPPLSSESSGTASLTPSAGNVTDSGSETMSGKTDQDLAKGLKASVNEGSGPKNTTGPILFLALIMLGAISAGVRRFMKKKVHSGK